MEKRQAIIYVRVSDDHQVDGTSLEFQEEECRKFCEKNAMEVVAVFREEGETAKDLSLNNRKELLRAIEFCRKNKGRIGAFVVLRVNRFARNLEDHFAVRKHLLNYGTNLYSVTEPIGNKPAEKLVEAVMAAAADYDNAIRKQQCSDGMSQKVNQGIYPWRPPVGYACAQFKKRGLKKTEPDSPDQETFPIIQKALKEFARGLCSQVELARKLDQWGLARIRGKKTALQFVDRMLGKNLRFYSGTLVNPWTGEEVPGLHTPMIAKEEALRIQLIRSGKKRQAKVKRERYNPEFPLRRTVICASCSKPLTGSCSRGVGGMYSYYHCYNQDCPMRGKAIGKDTLEKEFIRNLERITPREDFLAAFQKTVLDLWQEDSKSYELEAQKYERQLAALKAKRKRIFEMREDGSYSREEFQERKEEVENQIAAAKISMSECRIDQFHIEGALAYAINFIRNLGRQWFDLTPQLRPKFQKLVFPEGIPYDRETGFRTARLGLIYELSRAFEGDKSSLVDLCGFSWNSILRELWEFQKLKTSLHTAHQA